MQYVSVGSYPFANYSVVVSLVKAQVLGRVSTWLRPRYNRAVQGDGQELHVVTVGAIYRNTQRNPALIGPQASLGSGFAAIRRVGTRSFFPPTAPWSSRRPLPAKSMQFLLPYVFDNGKRITFQVWDWADDSKTYTVNQFMVQDINGTWETKHFSTNYRALQRHELSSILRSCGFTDVRWHMSEETGFYQSIVTARKPQFANGA